MNYFKYCKLSTLSLSVKKKFRILFTRLILKYWKNGVSKRHQYFICILQSNHFYFKSLKKQFSLCLKWIFFMTFILESFKHQQKSLQIMSKEKISKIEFKTRKCNWWYIVIRNWHFIHIFLHKKLFIFKFKRHLGYIWSLCLFNQMHFCGRCRNCI